MRSITGISAPTEEEIFVRELKQRQTKAFVILYDRYAPALFGMLLRSFNNPALAEDILQKTFCRAWNIMASYDPQNGRLLTWLMCIAKDLSKIQPSSIVNSHTENKFKHAQAG